MIHALITLILALSAPWCQARDPRRPKDPSIPCITVFSPNKKQENSWTSRHTYQKKQRSKHQLCSTFLRLKPIKHGFDQEFFDQHYLPINEILEYRDHSGVVNGSTLSSLANELITEIKVGQKKFTNFTILKDKDFNYKTLSGLIVAKYKNYPFVIKVSIEHAHTIVQPFSKSYEASGMFVIGGNLRHLSNFTRITNLHKIRDILSFNPFYLHNIDFPRKWYWKPDEEYNLHINWSCNNKKESIILPGIYATISDFIVTEEMQPQNELNKLSMKVAIDVGFLIDPHAGNILIEKGSRKYVLLDTENFRLMTGLDASMKATKYIGWYLELVNNALCSCLFRPKKDRILHSTTL